MKNITKKGFTLIEILVVIGIIAILAAIVIIAINPARQFAQARNSQRESNVNSLLNAIGQDLADNKGVFGGVCSNSLPTAVSHIYSDNSATVSGTSVGLGCLTPTYIPGGIPFDPTITSGVDTGYTVVASSTGRVTVCAPAAANETALTSPASICVTR